MPAGVLLPRLARGADLDIDSLREPGERLFLNIIIGFNVLVFAAFAVLTAMQPIVGLALVSGRRKLLVHDVGVDEVALASIVGHSVRVGPNQYPQIHRVVHEATDLLKIRMPTIVVMAGSGLVEILVAKDFSRQRLHHRLRPT